MYRKTHFTSGSVKFVSSNIPFNSIKKNRTYFSTWSIFIVLSTFSTYFLHILKNKILHAHLW